MADLGRARCAAAGLWAIAAAGAAAGLGLADIALTIAVLCLLVLAANRFDKTPSKAADDGDEG